MKILNENQMKDADVVISPDVKGHDAADFKNIDSLIQAGYNKTIRHIDEIKKDRFSFRYDRDKNMV